VSERGEKSLPFPLTTQGGKMVLENPAAVLRKYFSKGLGISQQANCDAPDFIGASIFSEQAILFLCLLWIGFSSLATAGLA
jgi:hypothetical protein